MGDNFGLRKFFKRCQAANVVGVAVRNDNSFYVRGRIAQLLYLSQYLVSPAKKAGIHQRQVIAIYQQIYIGTPNPDAQKATEQIDSDYDFCSYHRHLQTCLTYIILPLRLKD